MPEMGRNRVFLAIEQPGPRTVPPVKVSVFVALSVSQFGVQFAPDKSLQSAGGARVGPVYVNVVFVPNVCVPGTECWGAVKFTQSSDLMS